jgi:predicted nucleic acid-binding protein
MILVDTSIWIDFLNNKNDINSKKLSLILEEGSDICITDIILTEILQGIRDNKEYTKTKEILLNLKFIQPKSPDTYIQAADIYRACKKKGLTIRKTIDCIIAAIAIDHTIPILTDDKDFDNIAKCSNLKIYSKA